MGRKRSPELPRVDYNQEYTLGSIIQNPRLYLWNPFIFKTHVNGRIPRLVFCSIFEVTSDTGRLVVGDLGIWVSPEWVEGRISLLLESFITIAANFV